KKPQMSSVRWRRLWSYRRTESSLSIGFLSLVASFMSDALQGARRLQSRDDAMKVGQFPWALSRFSGRSWPHKLLSYLNRFVMAFHPLVVSLRRAVLIFIISLSRPLAASSQFADALNPGGGRFRTSSQLQNQLTKLKGKVMR